MPDQPITPLKPEMFRHYLLNHRDQFFVHEVMQNTTSVADTGYFEDHFARSTLNALSARTPSDILQAFIQKEINLLHAVRPFPEPPFPDFVVSPLGVVPKKTSEHRIILDLSRPDGASVNDFIDKETFSVSCCTIDEAINLMISLGKRALMAKQDIKHASRLVPVRTKDWHLLGFKVTDLFYFDIVLPFGCRSPPYHCCLISDAAHWILSSLTGRTAILHYVDDFFLVGDPALSQRQEVVSRMESNF